MRTLSADDIVRLAAHWPPLVDAADAALTALATGACAAPVRSSLPLIDGALLTMPGRLHGAPTAIVKLVSVTPRNGARGLPTIQGIAVVFDAETGAPVATLDGAALTAVRTGAVSAAAARRLADPSARTLALLGSGRQAAWQARAISAVLPIERVAVWSPTPAARERLAARLDRELPAAVSPVDSVSEATRDAAVVCCATTARAAFLRADMLASRRVFVAAIGAFQPDMAELDVSVFRRARRVYVDDDAAVRHEGGDVIQALRAGALASEGILPVGAVSGGAGPARDQDRDQEITVFKSVGSAVEDTAVAAALLGAIDQP